MATSNTVTTLNGFFKTVYGDSLKDLIPNWAIVQQDIGFSEGDRTGKDWRIPVVTQMEQGVTYLAPAAGVSALASSIAGATVELTVQGYQQILRAQLDYEAAFSAARSEAAFKRTTAHIVESMWSSARKRLELDLIYGRSPLGVILTGAGDTNTSVTISDATWAPGIWAGMEGAALYVAKADDSAVQTHGDGPYIKKVDLTNKKIFLDTNIDAAPTEHMVVGDKIFLKGQATASTGLTYYTMRGLDSILTYTSGSGSDTAFFGTHNFDRVLLRGVSVSAGSTDLSFGTIQDALAAVQARGADSDFTLLVSPVTWSNMMNDQSALRRYDASYDTGKLQLGAKTIEFWGPFGKVVVRSHPMIKEGEAFGYTPNLWKRIGATDITFSRPDLAGKGDGNSFFLELEGYNAFELRCYSHQSLFTYAPAKAFKITSIVNS